MEGVRVTLPLREELVHEHPCYFKPVYYAMFVEPIRDALRAIGIEPEPAGRQEHGVVMRWSRGKETVAALVDYADNNHVDGLVHFALKWDSSIRVLFKMKPCERYISEYGDFTAKAGIPIYSWGYLIAPTLNGEPEECISDRRWFYENLNQLRGFAANFGYASGRLMTRGSYHAMAACPERAKFYSPDLDQGGKDVPFQQHMMDVARSRFLLNLCGPDNTIDRKVVEACAMGVPMLSNDGLRDLCLPRMHRFIHGDNILFVNNVREIQDHLQNTSELDWNRLRLRSMRLYERCFSPRAVGTNMASMILGILGR